MSDRNDIMSQDEASSAPAPAESHAATNRLRRQLVKAGVAAVPTIISLQSGTAWAVSSCASRGVALPEQSDVLTAFGNIGGGGVDSTQQGNRDLVNAVTGLTDGGGGQIEGIIDAAASRTTGPGTFPEMGDVGEGDVIHLLVTNGSCWSSFCIGPVQNADVSLNPSANGNQACGL